MLYFAQCTWERWIDTFWWHGSGKMLLYCWWYNFCWRFWLIWCRRRGKTLLFCWWPNFCCRLLWHWHYCVIVSMRRTQWYILLEGNLDCTTCIAGSNGAREFVGSVEFSTVPPWMTLNGSCTWLTTSLAACGTSSTSVIKHLQELGHQIGCKSLDSTNPWQWTAIQQLVTRREPQLTE